MSATPRLFVEPDLVPGGSFALAAEQAHYLSRVLRLGEGAVLRLFNGRDGEYSANLASIQKRDVTLKVGQQTREQSASPDLWLAFAPIRRTLTDLVVEKSVELGVSRILPVRTSRTNAPPLKGDRLERIIIEAAEQTERLDIPKLDEEQPLAKMLEEWPPNRRIYFCDETGDEPGEPWGGRNTKAPTIHAALAGSEATPAAILIGPEGGFTPAEREDLRGRDFVTPVSLGPRVLRAETAAIAALALWQAIAGDWSPSAPEN